MKGSRKQNIKLGFFVAIGVLLFVVAIYFLGRNQSLFGRSVGVTAVFKDVRGLKVGNNVRYSGIEVGTVNRIRILNDSTIEVSMSIDQHVQKFIKNDATATVTTEGLMGSKIIEITTGSPGNPPLKEGDRLTTKAPTELSDILAEVQGMIKTTKEITQNLSQVTQKINEGKGLLGVLVNDSALPKELIRTTHNANKVTADIAAITEKLNNGKGDLGKLLNEDHLYTSLTNSVEKLNGVVKKSENTIANIDAFTYKLNNGKGVIQKMITDSVFADSLDVVLYNLNEGIVTATATAEAIENSWIINLFSKKHKK